MGVVRWLVSDAMQLHVEPTAEGAAAGAAGAEGGAGRATLQRQGRQRECMRAAACGGRGAAGRGARHGLPEAVRCALLQLRAQAAERGPYVWRRSPPVAALPCCRHCKSAAARGAGLCRKVCTW